MLRRLFISIIFVLSIILSACTTASNNNNNTNNDEEEITYSDHGGFLWKIEEGETEVYLQGTIHLGEKDTYPLNEYSETAYDEADVVLPEIDLNEIDIEKSQEIIMDKGMYEEGKTIADDLDEKSLEELETIIEDAGLDFQMIETFKPWYIENLLLELALEDTSLSSNYSVDDYFLNKASKDNKEIQELESFESQMDVLSGFKMEDQIESLQYSLEHYEEMDEEIEEMFDVWLAGDVDGILDYDDNDMEENSDYKVKINDERNEDMAESIEKILKEDDGRTYFVMVGSLHYVEEPSILSILEESGYEIEHIY